MDAKDWDRFLAFVEKGEVVPVLGPELLTVKIEGRLVPLYSYLARKLAEGLQLPNGTRRPATIYEVARLHIQNGGEPDDLYPDLYNILPDWDQVGLPEPLLRLARIDRLKLFVTTTFDPLLQRALDQERFGGEKKTTAISYSLSPLQDLGKPLDELEGPIVFHLFGSFSVKPDYAVTEEDALEFIHALQSGARSPERLLSELNHRQILLIGNSFSDCLARFFLRLARRDRLWRSGLVVANPRRRPEDASLVEFLRLFSAKTRIFDQGAAQFVNELSARWDQRRPRPGPPPVPPSPQEEMAPGAIFLSYAKEDRPFAETIWAELKAAGMEVWFDRADIEPGDSFEIVIKRNIEECSVFVPIISQNCLGPEPRFFRSEWVHAKWWASRYAKSRRFIVPVARDEALPQERDLQGYFDGLSWEFAETGPPYPQLVAAIKPIYRERQKALRGAP